MSLKSLDYLASKEGSRNLATLFTETHLALDKVTLETHEEFEDFLLEAINKSKTTYNTDEEKELLTAAIKDLYFSSSMYYNLMPTMLNAIENEHFTKERAVLGLIYMAGMFNASGNVDVFSKRDFIRSATLLYEQSQLANRNRLRSLELIQKKNH